MRSTGGYRFVLSLRWLRYIAIAIVAAIACGFLANWQDQRRSQRDAEIDRIETNYYGAAQPLEAVLPDRTAALPEEDEWQKVTARGTYDTAATVLARNRSLQNQAGFYVVVPLTLGTGEQIAVVRGWVPTDQDGAAPDPASIPAPPPGETEVEMWLRPKQDSSRDSNPPGLIRAIDPAMIPGLDTPYAEVYGELSTEVPPPAAEITALPEPSTSPGSHLSYTFQWITFGIMILGGLIYAARREKKSHETAVARAEAGHPAVEGGPAGGEWAAESGGALRGDSGSGEPGYVIVDKESLKRGGSRADGRARAGRQPSAEDYEDALLDSQGY